MKTINWVVLFRLRPGQHYLCLWRRNTSWQLKSCCLFILQQARLGSFCMLLIWIAVAWIIEFVRIHTFRCFAVSTWITHCKIYVMFCSRVAKNIEYVFVPSWKYALIIPCQSLSKQYQHTTSFATGNNSKVVMIVVMMMEGITATRLNDRYVKSQEWWMDQFRTLAATSLLSRGVHEHYIESVQICTIWSHVSSGKYLINLHDIAIYTDCTFKNDI